MSTDLVEQLSTVVIVIDSLTRIQSLNPAAEELIERSAQACQYHTLDALLHHPNSWKSLLDLAAQQQRRIVERNTTLDIPHTRQRHHADIALRQISIETYLIELHLFTRARGIMRSQALRHQGEHNRLFIRNLAHEIRNPLAGIKGAAQRVRDLIDEGAMQHAIDERALRYTDIIIDQSERLNRLLSTMVGDGKRERRLENIHRVIEDAVSVFANIEENREVAIKRAYDPSIPDIPIDANQIQQIILNLLSNAAAIKTSASRPNSAIFVPISTTV